MNAAHIVNEMLDADKPENVLRQHLKAVSSYTVKYPLRAADGRLVVITRVVGADDLVFFTTPFGINLFGSIGLRKANIWDGTGLPVRIDFPEIKL